ncbi:MAG: hypothetical protein IPO27_10770 [Bacteroidetes bacterium]|nr:hypothetical protein [Bacteroidota bacterium]
MKTIYLIIALFVCNKVVAQNKNSVWVFGDSAGIDFSNVNVPMPIGTSIDGRGSCVSISDSIGNLALYAATFSNGGYSTKIFNGNHQQIQGGDSIAGSAWYNELVLIPNPNNYSQYYIFSVGVDGFINGLYYTLIDISLNNGIGGVLSRNVQLDTVNNGDRISAVKHGNGRDWWIISKYADVSLTKHNRFYIHKVDTGGITYIATQDFYNATDAGFQKIIWHPSGSKFMNLNIAGYLEELNFDRCSGFIAVYRTMYTEIPAPYCCRYFWEGAYSKSGNVFYASTTGINSQFSQGYLLQYNLLDSNPTLTVDTLDTFDTPIGTGVLRLAPDNKIYFSRAYES